MNTKRKVNNPNAIVPTYLYEIDVDVENKGKIKTYRLQPWTAMTVHWESKRPGLYKGIYSFLYAERVSGELLIYTDWKGKRKTIREADIKTVARRE